MLRKLGPALVIFGLLTVGVATAAPLTFYTNEADWLAAVSPHQIGPYPYPVTETQTLTTVDTDNTGLVILDNTIVTSEVLFSTLFYNFTQP